MWIRQGDKALSVMSLGSICASAVSLQGTEYKNGVSHIDCREPVWPSGKALGW